MIASKASKGVLMIKYIFILTFFLQTYTLTAQTSEERMHAFSLTFDNDFWFRTDKYYTNGVELKYEAPVFGRSFITKSLLALNGSKSYYSLSLRQNMYTPADYSNDVDHSGDRPFAPRTT